MKKYRVENLDCPDCTLKLEEAVSRLDCVTSARFVFATGELHLETSDFPRVETLVKQLEPQVKLLDPHAHSNNEKNEPRLPWLRELIFLCAGTFLWALGLVAEAFPPRWGSFVLTGEILQYVLLLPLYLLFGFPVLKKAIVNLLRGDLFDENFLMALATAAAWFIGAGTEALSVMLFYQWGEFFQDRAVERSRRSIGTLLQKKPSLARVNRGGWVEVEPEAVLPQEVIEVRPGERVPLDGEIVSGFTQVDTSSLTGESLPRELEPGAQVLAGFVNGSGLISVKVTRPYSESVYAALVHSVDAALAKKAPLEKFITRFARVYTPLVIAFALVFFAVLAFSGFTVKDALYRSLVMLMVSCPCALVISIPLTYLAAMGQASRLGLLIKDAGALDKLHRIDTVLWDKTGTLTKGKPRFVHHKTAPGQSEVHLEACLTAGLSKSTHPLASSYLSQKNEALVAQSALQISQVQEVSGKGLLFTFQGQEGALGRHSFLREQGFPTGEISASTSVHAAFKEAYLGCAVFEDLPKSTAAEAVDGFRQLGITSQGLISGDHEEAVRKTAEPMGLIYHAELLPQGKVKVVEDYLQKGSKVLFVGDGLNDAPVMACSTVGVSLGAGASAAAIEIADVAVLDDSPSKAVALVALGRKTQRIVMQNIALALVIKGVFLALGGLGIAGMAEAVFADGGTALLAVLNSLRAGTGELNKS